MNENGWALAFLLSMLAMPVIIDVGWKMGHAALGYGASIALLGLTALLAQRGSD